MDAERRKLLAEKRRLAEENQRLAAWRFTHEGNRRLANFLSKHLHEVFAYLRHPGMAATNYRGEQAIRPAVVNRKVSRRQPQLAGRRGTKCADVGDRHLHPSGDRPLGLPGRSAHLPHSRTSPQTAAIRR